MGVNCRRRAQHEGGLNKMLAAFRSCKVWVEVRAGTGPVSSPHIPQQPYDNGPPGPGRRCDALLLWAGRRARSITGHFIFFPQRPFRRCYF